MTQIRKKLTKEEARQLTAIDVTGIYIAELRKEKKIRSAELYQGLCDEHFVKRFERNEAEVELFMEERLLNRLGMDSVFYERYVDYEVYDRWELENRILCRLTHENTEGAAELLRQYNEKYRISDCLAEQFYLSQTAMLRLWQGESEYSVRGILQMALELTVPNWESQKLEKLVLAPCELELMLRLEHGKGNDEDPKRYRAIERYLSGDRFDKTSLAKIYPQTVYYLLRCEMGREAEITEGEKADWLPFCEQAVTLIRDTCRAQYLWELLGIRDRLLARELEEAEREGHAVFVKRNKKLLEQNQSWRETLEELYRHYGIAPKTIGNGHVCQMRNVVCYNDVIRIRREMLNLSRQELCEDICSLRTLLRLEQKEKKTQTYYVRQLLYRVGLSGCLLQRTLNTGGREALELGYRIGAGVNNYRKGEVKEMLERLFGLISVDTDWRVIRRWELWNQRVMNEITTEKYVEEIQALLELTVPLEVILSRKSIYLSNIEISCIQNMLVSMNVDNELFWPLLDVLDEYYQPLRENEAYAAWVAMSEFVLCYVQSARGNAGEFDRANDYNQWVLEEGLRLQRLDALSDTLYGMWWNHAECRSRETGETYQESDKKALEHCVVLAELSRKTQDEPFFREKLKNLKEPKLSVEI